MALRSVRATARTSGSESAAQPGCSATARTSCPRSRSSRAMAADSIYPAGASLPDGILASGPGCVCLGYLLLIGLDPLIDLVPVGAVVADGGLYEAERQLKMACRLGGVTVVISYGRDDLPHVFAGSCQPGAPACWSVGKPDERMLIHPQPLFHVTLCQGAGG